jgi:hypothetical protein
MPVSSSRARLFTSIEKQESSPSLRYTFRLSLPDTARSARPLQSRKDEAPFPTGARVTFPVVAGARIPFRADVHRRTSSPYSPFHHALVLATKSNTASPATVVTFHFPASTVHLHSARVALTSRCRHTRTADGVLRQRYTLHVPTSPPGCLRWRQCQSSHAWCYTMCPCVAPSSCSTGPTGEGLVIVMPVVEGGEGRDVVMMLLVEVTASNPTKWKGRPKI